MFKQLLFKGLACIALLSDEEENKRSKHNRIWVHEMLRKRKIESEFATLYRELIEPIVEDAAWGPGLVWTGGKNLAPTGIRYPKRPARSESLSVKNTGSVP